MNHDLTSTLDPDDVPAEWWAERMRLHRDRLLKESDWTQVTRRTSRSTGMGDLPPSLTRLPNNMDSRTNRRLPRYTMKTLAILTGLFVAVWIWIWA
jgi:hypothetical protein